MQVEQMKVASQQLQSAVRRDVLLSELDGKIAFDHVSQLRYFQTHKTGLQGLEILFSGISLNISLEAFSFNIAASISQIYFRIEVKGWQSEGPGDHCHRPRAERFYLGHRLLRHG
jgi:hypothetical protein